MATRLIMLLLGVIAALSVSGCIPWSVDLGPGATLVNDVGQRVRLSSVDEHGLERSLSDQMGGDILESGQERRFNLDSRWDASRQKSCELVGLIARSDNGQPVASVPAPVCADDRILLSEFPPATGAR